MIGAQYSLSYKEEKLIDIVKLAYEGEFVLPDFQRNFVWNRIDIEELIKSILENIFIGVFLIQRVDPRDPPFKVIPVKGAKGINTQTVSLNLILDGQQRITSLLYALYAPDYPLRNTAYRHFFFLDLDGLAEGDTEKGVFSLSVNDRRLKSVLKEDGGFDIEELKKRKWLPLVFLSKSESEFHDLWYRHFYSLFRSPEDARNVWSIVTRVFNYTVPVFYLDRARPEDVIVLFERLNKTGIRLSLYDLVVARVYKFIKLKDKWVEAYELNSNIRKLAGDVENTNIPYLIIQALALSSGLGVRYNELIRIDERILNEDNWNRAVNVFEARVLEMVFDVGHYGVVGPRWIPYLPMLSVMLAVFLKVDHPSEDKIDRWYWSSVFSERYSGSTVTVMKKDFDQICAWLEDDAAVLEAIDDLSRQIRTETLGLVRVSRFSNVKYKGVFNLLFKEGANDFYHVSSNIRYHRDQLEDHHIFPKTFLGRFGIRGDVVDSVLNRTLILGETNRKISNKAPAQYLNEIIESVAQNKGVPRCEAEELTRSLFRKHFINDEMFDILKEMSRSAGAAFVRDNFERFLELREQEIIKKIKGLTGL